MALTEGGYIMTPPRLALIPKRAIDDVICPRIALTGDRSLICCSQSPYSYFH